MHIPCRTSAIIARPSREPTDRIVRDRRHNWPPVECVQIRSLSWSRDGHRRAIPLVRTSLDNHHVQHDRNALRLIHPDTGRTAVAFHPTTTNPWRLPNRRIRFPRWPVSDNLPSNVVQAAQRGVHLKGIWRPAGDLAVRNSYLVRWPSMALQASSASVSDLKGDPPTLMAHLF